MASQEIKKLDIQDIQSKAYSFDNPNYFTEEKLKDAVGDNGLKQLENISINPGDAFLNGKQTNEQLNIKSDLQTEDIFNKVGDIIGNGGEGVKGILSNDISNKTSEYISNNKYINDLADSTAVGIGAYKFGSELYSNSPEIITSLSTAIISKVTEEISKEISILSSEYLANHLRYSVEFPNRVNECAREYFEKNKKSPQDLLNNFVIPSEERSQKIDEQNNKKNLSSFIDKAKKNSTDFINKINTYSKTAADDITKVTKFIKNGPEDLIKETNRQMDSLLSGIRKKIDTQWEKDKAIYDEKVNILGKKIGKEMVSKHDNALEQAQKKIMENMNKAKAKNSIKLTVSKATVASKLASITGIYIPI